MMEWEDTWGEAAVPVPAPRRPVPWEDPEVAGLTGFFRTLGDLLFHPGRFFQTLEGEGWAEPLAFALIVSTFGLLGALFWNLLVMAPIAAPGDVAGLASFSRLDQGMTVALMAVSPLLVLLNLGVGSLCWWGSVAMLGAVREFTPAWRIFCYAQAGMALALIPFFGLLVAGLWTLALMYSGAKKVYGFSAWSTLAALAIFLSLQAVLGMLLLLGLAALASLGFLLLLLG
jgi:hypothetical protein